MSGLFISSSALLYSQSGLIDDGEKPVFFLILQIITKLSVVIEMRNLAGKTAKTDTALTLL